MKNLLHYNKKEMILAYSFILPLAIILIFLIFIPVVGAFINSLYQDISFLGEKKFIGFENYIQLAQTGKIWTSTRFTVTFAITSIFFEIIFGIMIALFLNESFKGRGLYRALILLPWAIPSSVSGKIWLILYDYQFGLFNWFIALFGIEPVFWLGRPNTAFFAIVVANVWKALPFVVLLLLAGMQAISSDLYSQAKIDATPLLKRLTHITLPLLLPIILITMLFRTIDNIRVFDLIYLLTRGGPGGTTDSLSYLGYSYFGQSNYGLGSAVSVIIFTLTFSVSLIYVYVTSRVSKR